MMVIFFQMVEKIIEVFMDDLLMFGTSFDECLKNVRMLLTNLMLNWKKCHFMTQKGIVHGH